MTRIQWGLDYFTGLPEVDRQHEELFALINRLHDANVDHPEILNQTFEDLRDYVHEHFAVEEQLMVEANIDAADYARHRAAHAAFAKRLSDLWHAHCDGDENAAEELLAFLNAWLTEHILQTDRKMALEIHRRMGTQAPHNMFSHF